MNNFFDELEKNNVDTHKDIKNIKNSSSKNKISSIIKALCWTTIVIGFIYGIINYILNEDALQMFTTWLIYGGCTLGGFALAEIIQILHDIRNKLYSNKK